MNSPQPWPLTGRAEEIELITDVIGGNDPQAGIAILGPAGIGKSRLAREAAAAASARGWVVRTAMASHSAQAIPLGAFAEWAHNAAAGSLQAASSVIDRLTQTTRGRPVLVNVDDAHHLDDVSAFLVQQLVVRRLATVVLTARTGQPAPDAITSLWKDGHLRLLRLQPLSRAECQDLLAEVLGGPIEPLSFDRMWRLTNGNVLQLRHLVDQELRAAKLSRHDEHWHWIGDPDMSGALMDLIDAQVGAVSEPVLNAIDTVSVAEPLNVDMLSALAGTAAIEDAERRGLLTITPGACGDLVARIGHPLYGEIRRVRAGALRLRRLRGRVAEAILAKPHPDDNDLIRAGTLWLESDLPADPPLLLRAAGIAFHRFDLGLAEKLAAASGSPSAVLLRAQALGLTNRAGEAVELLTTAEQTFDDESDLAAAAALRIGTLWGPLNRPDDTIVALHSALDDSRPAVAAAARCMNTYFLAAAGRPDDALAQASSASLQGFGSFAACSMLSGRIIALGDAGRSAEAEDVARIAYQLAEDNIDGAYFRIGIAELHVRTRVRSGAIAEALTLGHRISEQCADIPGGLGAMGLGIGALADLGAGRLDRAHQALQAMDRALASWPATKLRARFAIAHLEATARLGLVDQAAAIADRLRPPQHPELASAEPDRLVALAWLDAARGLTSRARTGARKAAELACSRGQFAREVVCLQAATHLGDADTAERLAQLAKMVSGPRAQNAAAFAAALRDSNGDRLRAASEKFETMGDLLAAADAAAHAAIAFRRAGLRGSALTAATRAQRIAQTCGGAITPALTEASQPLPLTAREREIIRLVAEGMSNREIAAELVMSIRTVEGHLYRASQRAGTNSRDELVSLLRECPSDARQ